MKATLTLLLLGFTLASCSNSECGGSGETTCRADLTVENTPTLVLDETPMTLSGRVAGRFWIQCAAPDMQSGACLDDVSPSGTLFLAIGLNDNAFGVTTDLCQHVLQVALTIPPGSTLTAGTVLSAVVATATFQRVNADSSGCVSLKPIGEYSTSSAVVTVLANTGARWSFSIEADLTRTSPAAADAGSLPARVRMKATDATCIILGPSC